MTGVLNGADDDVFDGGVVVGREVAVVVVWRGGRETSLREGGGKKSGDRLTAISRSGSHTPVISTVTSLSHTAGPVPAFTGDCP